ncbi:MAG: polysaccharide deacetylase [Firmicutes bacterium]|nr:polysaccharide deacetylase [Bacillota bacterium]
MRTFIIKRISKWHFGFAISFLLLLTLLPGLVQRVNIEPEKPRPIYQGATDKPQVALACNVFWGEEYLPEMLDVLDKNNIKITFFIGGSWAKRHPDIVKMIANGNHELGNHTYSHPHPNVIDKEANKEQIVKTETLIKELTGIKTTLYAPPYGEFNDTVLKAASEAGYTTILWSIDTIDWKRPSPDIIIERVMNKIHNGAIILMHPTEPTLKALPTLISKIQGRGYKIVSVSLVVQ